MVFQFSWVDVVLAPVNAIEKEHGTRGNTHRRTGRRYRETGMSGRTRRRNRGTRRRNGGTGAERWTTRCN